MKTLRIHLLVLIVFGLGITSYAQNTGSIAIDNDRKAWIGINFGGFWQSSDVKSALSGASGLTFDYYFIRNNRSVFGLGARGQYLIANSYGLGVSQDFGIQSNTSLSNYAALTPPDNYVYQNHLTEISDISGNLIISLNRLRATTGLHLYLFGGLGGTGYIAKMDQLDASGSIYDYTAIDATGSDSEIRDALDALRDGDYETYSEDGSDRVWTLTPTVGAGIGIQISQRISIGLEHKIGFTGTDLLDGNQWNEVNQLDTKNDKYHYSAVSVSIGLGQLPSGGGGAVKSDLTPTVPSPVIDVLVPSTSLYTSQDCSADIRARITNITMKQNITVKRSGETMNLSEFSWNAGSRILEIHEPLRENTMTYAITAANEGGSASRIVIINCPEQTLDEGPTISPPVINITSPSSSNFQTTDCNQQIIAKILNVRSKDQIQITENGRSLSQGDFGWNPRTSTMIVKATIDGSSRYVITAKNNSGTSTEGTTITCVLSEPQRVEIMPPTLVIVTPNRHPFTAVDCVAKLTVKTTNISSKDQITVFENGGELSPVLYTFNSNTGNITLSRGLPGGGKYLVKVQNEAGSATVAQDFICPQAIEEVSITICHYPSSDRRNPQTIRIPTIEWPQHAQHGDTQGTCPVVDEPRIIINSPSISPITVEDCLASIEATVQNVEDKEDIEVLNNGQPIPFSFSGQTVSVRKYSFTGTSTFTILVTNLKGTITKSVSFVCEPKSVEMITICHSTRGASPRTMSIPASEWASHQAHGDTQGACPAIEAPVISLVSPATSPVTLENCVASIRASVTNMPTRQGISVTQNGRPISFNYARNTISVSNIAFTGTANFTISARNNAGTSTQIASFICKPPVEMITICHNPSGATPQTMNIPATEWTAHQAHGDTRGACPVIEAPVVSLISPATSPVTLENCVATIQATVTNISSKQGISVTQNGRPVNFSFSGNTVSVSNINFTGTANFVITATNSSGKSTQTASFICQPPVEMITICHNPSGATPQTMNIPATEWTAHQAHGDARGACPVIEAPVVSLISPATSPVTLENCVATVQATVTNISSKQGISVTQNGRPVNFSFSGNTVSVSNVNFTGTANFVITATNSSGRSTQTASFICQPPVEMITICHNPSGATPQTMNIPATEWTAHQAHGDTRGACPVIEAPVVSLISPATSPVTLENCVATVQATVTNISSKQGISVTQNGRPVNFSFSGNTVSVSNVNFTGTANFVITATNSSGRSTQTASFICQPPVEMITICHNPPGNPDNPQSISIPESAWPAHEAHGDTQGECPVIQPPVVTVNSPGSSTVTVEDCKATINAQIANIDNKNGVTVTQNGSPVAFTYSGNSLRISNLEFTGTAIFVITATNPAGSSAQTITFICQLPEEEITICHYPPGNPDNPQSISIPESAWPAHEAHGDIQGECPVIQPPVVTVNSPGSSTVTVEDCKATINAQIANIDNKNGVTVTQNGSLVAFTYSGNSLRISNLEFTGTAIFVITATNPAGSSAQTITFICQPPEEEITICHYPPGNPDNPQSISIPESAWPAHEAHGDIQGECPVIQPPVVTVNSPQNSPATVNNCKASIRATVSNIENENQISVDQDGSSISFDFSGNSVRISNIDFKNSTVINIQVTNSAGSDSESVTFICPQEETEEEEKKENENEKLTICHYPPGNKQNPQTISIPASAWPAHEKHGDKMGPCNN